MTASVSTRRHVIADDLRRQISSGHFKADERLPSEAQLATHYTVSTSTLRSALALLQGEGLVEKIHGDGNFVRGPLRKITYTGGAATSASWTAYFAPIPMTARTTSIEAPSHLATLLNVPPRSRLTELLYLAHEEKVPHGLAYIYVLDSVASVTPPAVTTSPEQRSAPIVAPCPALVEVQERISARLPTEEEAMTLRISVSLAVLSLTRVVTDFYGRVVDAALLVLPSDRADVLFTTSLSIEERTQVHDRER
ncbi:GntR family transcriptional regulator [Streptomyces sp. NPDC059558]|uniref:GntR family transcriptional regulator n=1 Tax=Streptomyces sp. NPDC059558 TaxID=3346864 RepID=UPI0036CC9099